MVAMEEFFNKSGLKKAEDGSLKKVAPAEFEKKYNKNKSPAKANPIDKINTTKTIRREPIKKNTIKSTVVKTEKEQIKQIESKITNKIDTVWLEEGTWLYDPNEKVSWIIQETPTKSKDFYVLKNNKTGELNQLSFKEISFLFKNEELEFGKGPYTPKIENKIIAQPKIEIKKEEIKIKEIPKIEKSKEEQKKELLKAIPEADFDKILEYKKMFETLFNETTSSAIKAYAKSQIENIDQVLDF